MGKILVIAAAIVMIAAGTGIAYTAIEHEKEKENGTEDGLFGSSGTDYSLLDPSNIVAGLTVTYTGTPYYGEYEERILVTSVNGDDVDFLTCTVGLLKDTTVFEVAKFSLDECRTFTRLYVLEPHD